MGPLVQCLKNKLACTFSSSVIFDFFRSIYLFKKDHEEQHAFIQDLALLFITKSCFANVNCCKCMVAKIDGTIMSLYYVSF